MEKLKNKITSLLRWSERYTKTDMVYLAEGGSWLGFSQAVSTGAAFLTSIAFANLLPPETYGIYKFVLSIASLIFITSLSGIDSAVTQAVARGFENTLSVGFKTKIKWGSLGSLVSLVMAGYYYFQGNPVLALAFCVVAVFAPFSESFDLYNSLLWGKKLFGVQTRFNIIRKIFSVLILVGVLFATKNVITIITTYFLVMTLPAGFFLWRSFKKYRENTTIDPEAISYGKKLSAVYIISLIIGELDKILIFHYLGATNLAIYALAIAPNDQIKGLLKNVNALAMPQFSSRTSKEIKRTIWHKVLMLTLFISAIVFVYIIFAPFLFEIFFPKYIESVFYSQILSLSLIPVVIASFLYTVLESQKDQRSIYRYNVYSNIFSIIALWPLVYCFGIMGAVVTRVVSRLLILGISLFSVKNLDPKSEMI